MHFSDNFWVIFLYSILLFFCYFHSSKASEYFSFKTHTNRLLFSSVTFLAPHPSRALTQLFRDLDFKVCTKSCFCWENDLSFSDLYPVFAFFSMLNTIYLFKTLKIFIWNNLRQQDNLLARFAIGKLEIRGSTLLRIINQKDWEPQI